MKILLKKYHNKFTNNWRNNPVIFNWLLIMTGAALPFPDYSLVSKFIILLGLYWLFFQNSIHEKIAYLKQNIIALLSVSILYLLPVLGLLYSDNLEGAFKDLILKLPFLLLPLIIFSTQNVLAFKTWHKYFAYSVSLVSLSAIIQALYFKYRFGVDYTFYHEFSYFTQKHTTYYGLFLSLSILYFIWHLLENKKNRFLILSSLSVLFIALYFNGNRMSLLSSLVGISILIFYKLSLKYKFTFGFGLLLLFLLFTKTDFYQNRIKTLVSDTAGQNELALRKKHLKAVLNTIKHNNIWFGAGTESHRDYLYNKYREAGNKNAFLEKYNAHNQFLEICLDFGILGLIVFIVAVLYQFRLIIKNNRYYFLAVYISIIIFMFAESLLERQNGIIVWALFISLILHEINNNTISLTEAGDKKVPVNQ